MHLRNKCRFNISAIMFNFNFISMVKKLRCYVLLDEQQKKQVNRDFRRCVADLIISAREKSGLTARDLSLLSGIDPSNLCRIEKGKQGISVSIFFRLLYCLGYDSIGIKI